ncbi:MAG: hypothetical protein GOMPHAMPRED_000855 [Gomphillus americanus]|uniref:UEV domain-containing protein n=1 Tax=Gomphillus americanus TaxID=1940652 RepID=A0A8H3F7R3_9LECA|nr:MAG: hypothetical protein GOMPHAMPRED_000855 [Gomphillus americanus]
MVVRSGQHVSSEGRIYHPYLAKWNHQCQLVELLKVLEDIFSREPPVVAKPSGQYQPVPQSTGVAAPPPRPPLPVELRRDGSNNSAERRPSLPPKPFEQRLPSFPPRSSLQSRPPPPLPQESRQAAAQTRLQTLPPSQVSLQSFQPFHINPSLQTQTLAYQTPTLDQVPGQIGNRINASQGISGQPVSWTQPAYSQQPQSQNHTQNQSIQRQPQPQPLDLLTSPFDPPLPLQAENLPAPPIPPNPEKDALLSAISHSLTTQLQSVVTSNAAAIQPLTAQHAAMTHALHNLQQERGALLQLQSLLDSNEQILHQAMHDADECIASAQHKAVPGVDEVLFAPTVVGQQLYDLIAEEKASVETRDVLSRALDRGRISSELQKIQGNAKQDRAQTENTLSHTVGKVGPYTISGSGTLTKDDPDRSRGEWNQTFGAAKEAFGGLVGAEGLKADGIRQNREGKEQEARGQVNDFGKGVGDRVAGAVGGVVASLTGDQNAQDEFRRLHDVGKTMQRSAETDVQRKQQ